MREILRNPPIRHTMPPALGARGHGVGLHYVPDAPREFMRYELFQSEALRGRVLPPHLTKKLTSPLERFHPQGDLSEGWSPIARPETPLHTNFSPTRPIEIN